MSEQLAVWTAHYCVIPSGLKHVRSLNHFIFARSTLNIIPQKFWKLVIIAFTIRYDNEIFIVRSKADYSQLNLPHCTITEKIMTRNSKTKQKTETKKLRSTGSRQEAVESVLRKEKTSLWWEWFEKKIGLKPGVKERGSYGLWKRRWNTSSGNDESRKIAKEKSQRRCHGTFKQWTIPTTLPQQNAQYVLCISANLLPVHTARRETTWQCRVESRRAVSIHPYVRYARFPREDPCEEVGVRVGVGVVQCYIA